MRNLFFVTDAHVLEAVNGKLFETPPQTGDTYIFTYENDDPSDTEVGRTWNLRFNEDHWEIVD